LRKFARSAKIRIEPIAARSVKIRIEPKEQNEQKEVTD